MDRLTYRHEDQHGNPTNRISPEIHLAYQPRDKWIGKVAIRLAAIEDILGDDYDLDRLRELVEADRDGRCVVLPCKVGDTVYIVTHEGGSLLAGMEIVKCQVNTIRVKSDGHTIGYSCRGRYSNGNHYIGNFVFKSIGKTVFLTREAAEAALKGEQHGQ